MVLFLIINTNKNGKINVKIYCDKSNDYEY